MNGTVKKLNIFHHYTGQGGASISLLVMCKALIKAYDIHVYLNKTESNWLPNKLKEFEIPYTTLQLGLRPLRIFQGSKLNLAVTIAHLIVLIIIGKFQESKIRNADIFIANSLALSYLGIAFNNRKQSSLIFQRETRLYPLNSLRNKVLNHLLSHFDKIVHISDFDSKEKELNIHNQYVLPNIPIGTPSLEDLNRADNNLFFPGGFNQIKGLENILRAYRSSKTNIPLILNLDPLEVESELRNNKLSLSLLKKSVQYKRRCCQLIRSILDEGRDIRFSPKNSMPWSEFTFMIVWPTVPHQLRLISESLLFKKKLILPFYRNYDEFVNKEVAFVFNDMTDLVRLLNKLDSRACDNKVQDELREAVLSDIDSYESRLLKILEYGD